MRITVNGKSAEFDGSVGILDACRRLGVTVYAPCGGDGRCGKCKVAATGALSPLTEAERERLTDEEIASGVRLACRAFATGDAAVTVGDGNDMNRDRDRDRDEDKNPDGADIIRKQRRLGAAVDIGTTTLTVTAVDMDSGARVAERVRRNPQSVYGADVISRIAAAEKYGTDALREPLTEVISEMRRELFIPDDAETVFVGNTTMLTIWAGIDPSPLGKAPFSTPDKFGRTVNGAYVPRCVSAYVGADAVASAIAAGLADHDGAVADIGTNGEIISRVNGAYRASAAAAGPALEGAGIACGMTATVGAVCAVSLNDAGGTPDVETIGNAPPAGICGSGLIDAAAALLDMGVIDEDGGMRFDFELADGVKLTRGDVRALQLAKAALRAAIDMTTGGNVDRMYLSGGFGSTLNVASCARIGLIPSAIAEKTVVLGNGAITGAELMLISDEWRKKSDMIAENAVYIELSGSREFERRFIDEMRFPARD